VLGTVVGRAGEYHRLPRRRLDALLVGVCVLAWVFVLVGR